MKTIYLHVGLHKTASTALQGFFNSNRKVLLDAGIYYPETGKTRHGMHHHLPWALFVPHHPNFSPQADFRKLLNQLKEEIHPYSRILISSEVFSENIDRAQSVLFKEICDEVKIVIYLRRQDLYIESTYSHAVNHQQMPTPFSNFNFHGGFNLDYQQTVDQWANLFGKENIIVRIYEKGQFTGGSIFSDFLSIMGLPLSPELTLSPRKANTSLPRDLIEFKRLCNQLKLNNSINHSLVKLPEILSRKTSNNPYRYIPPNQRKELLEKYAASNAYIARKFLSRTNGTLFYAPLFTEEWKPYPGLTDEKILKILTFLQKDSPTVFNELCSLIRLGSQSDENIKQKAAVVLGRGINHLLPDKHFSLHVYFKNSIKSISRWVNHLKSKA